MKSDQSLVYKTTNNELATLLSDQFDCYMEDQLIDGNRVWTFTITHHANIVKFNTILQRILMTNQRIMEITNG